MFHCNPKFNRFSKCSENLVFLLGSLTATRLEPYSSLSLSHRPSYFKSSQGYFFHIHQSHLSSWSPALCHFNGGPDHPLCWRLQQPPNISPCLHSCLHLCSKRIFWNLKSDPERFSTTFRIKSKVLSMAHNTSNHLVSLISPALASSRTIHCTRITWSLLNILWFPNTFFSHYSQVISTV